VCLATPNNVALTHRLVGLEHESEFRLQSPWDTKREARAYRRKIANNAFQRPPKLIEHQDTGAFKNFGARGLASFSHALGDKAQGSQDV
jgi:hypothetical protein